MLTRVKNEFTAGASPPKRGAETQSPKCLEEVEAVVDGQAVPERLEWHFALHGGSPPTGRETAVSTLRSFRFYRT